MASSIPKLFLTFYCRPHSGGDLMETIKTKKVMSPFKILALGFASVIFTGAVLLSLPVATVSGESTHFLDALFTSTSAVCVTGLVVVDTGTYWSFFGQLVILFLIEIGGLGFMAMSTIFAIILGKKISLRERLVMQEAYNTFGLQGVIRGKPPRTTIADKALPCPADRVNRVFKAPRPDALWVADFTYVATWSGFVYVAFVIDAFARRIVGWRVSRSAHAGFVLDELEQALHERRPAQTLIHHSDRGSQYVSIAYTERLADAGIEPSVGSVGDSYDNALAETINGLYKAEVIHRRGPWRSLEHVEFATLEWVAWFNTQRLLGPIGNIPPAEAEARYWADTEHAAIAA